MENLVAKYPRFVLMSSGLHRSIGAVVFLDLTPCSEFSSMRHDGRPLPLPRGDTGENAVVY
jgi:hypothetical protein